MNAIEIYELDVAIPIPLVLFGFLEDVCELIPGTQKKNMINKRESNVWRQKKKWWKFTKIVTKMVKQTINHKNAQAFIMTMTTEILKFTTRIGATGTKCIRGRTSNGWLIPHQNNYLVMMTNDFLIVFLSTFRIVSRSPSIVSVCVLSIISRNI